MKKLSPNFKINVTPFQDEKNKINNNNENSNDVSELLKQNVKEKRVIINFDLNKTATNIKSKKSIKKSILKPKKSSKMHNYFNLENDNKLDKSHLSLLKVNNMDYPKSSVNVKKQFENKSFLNDNNSFFNKSFHYKGKYNKTKKHFLDLINPNNVNKVYNQSQCSPLCGKDFFDYLEKDSLNLIQKNLQHKIFDMGKEPEFMEFEIGSLNMSINRLNKRNQFPKLTKKITKKEEEKRRDLNSRTVIHGNIFKGNSNIVNSSSGDCLLSHNNERTCIYKNKNRMKFSNKKLVNNLLVKNSILKKNSLKNNIAKKYYKINLMKSDVNGRRSSINHYLKSTHSFKSSVINRSKTALNSKAKSSINDSSPRNFTDNTIISSLEKRKALFYNLELFRNLEHRKLVYDSLDDDEIIEDAINVNFYLNPDDKIILIIDCLALFFSFWNIIYKPLSLVLNNCDVKNTILSFSLDNISNILIDILFILDLIINFFKAYYNFDEQLVTRSDKIILNYIKGYFLLDFICAIPYYSIIKIIAFKKYKDSNVVISCSKYYDHEINDRYQIFEMLKLMKLIKCVSNNNIITNYLINNLNQIVFFETWSYLLSSVSFTLLILHLTACTHIFISCTTFPNWIVQKNLHTSRFIKIYLSSIYFLITTVTSVGYGDIIGSSFTEIIFQIILLMVGIIAYSWLISSISNYVQENNSQSEVFNQKIAILKEIKLENPKMTKELFDKIYLHLEYINLKQKKDKSSLIDSLPHSVKKPLLYEMYKPLIENFNFFKNYKNSEFVNRVISKLKPVLAVKNDLLLEQGEIIEDTIFVKQGRLGLEVKIDTDHPEKSIEKLLNEEYFFGLENNELYQKSTFGGFISMTSINRNQTFINKQNLYNLYSGNNLPDNNINPKRLKSIVTNSRGETEIQKHPNLIINYINLRILDIRKNEHFGALLMFLNKRSPLTLRVKTKKAELFFLKKIDAVEISTSYPNIWKRVNKKSFHNLKQIKKIMKKIIKHFCETYGIDFDFGTRINNYLRKTTKNLQRIKSNSVKKKQNLKFMQNIKVINNKILNPRRSSVGQLNSQMKMLQSFPKQTNIFTTKTNFEKDIEDIIPKNFERNNEVNKNINKTKKSNKKMNNYEKKSNNEIIKEKDNPMDLSVSMIKLAKKDTYLRYNNASNKNDDTNNLENNYNDSKDDNSNVDESNNNKINNLKSDNHLNFNSKKKLQKYGEEETNNLMKFFGTPYYPEDINDEVYPGEMFELVSQRANSNNIYEQEYSSINNNLLLSCDNNLPKMKNNLIGQNTLNNFDINNKSNNFTINNNYITNNVINNVSSQKYNNNLNIFTFSFSLQNNITNNKTKTKKNTDNTNLTIFKNSFEISTNKLDNFKMKSNKTNNKVSHKNNITNKEKSIKNSNKKIIKKKNSVVLKTKVLKNENIPNKINKNNTITIKRKNNDNIDEIKNNESESYSSDDGSYSFSSYSSNSYSNDDNIFKCYPQIKNTKFTLKTVKTTLRPNKVKPFKNMKINKNVIIKINGCYENLNMISDGKISKSKKLQNCIKNILIKKVLKHKNDKKEEIVNPVSPTNQKRRKSFSIKLVKHKTMAKNIPENFKKNNLYKVTINTNTFKKTDVKSRFKKHMISEINDKGTISPKKIIKDLTSSSLPKKAKGRKKNDEFLLDYVNRNIRDDNAVLNNPGKFYNGLFNNIMKKVTIKLPNNK